MSDSRDVEYLDSQEFNDDFDSLFDRVSFGHIGSYKASYVLFNVDYQSYLQEIENFEERIFESKKEVILSSYPQPISYYFHQAEKGFRNHNHRLQLLRSTWEAIIFMLYAVVLGEARSKSFPLRSIAEPKPDGNPDLSFTDYFGDRLAQKLLIVERILAYSRNNNIPLTSSDLIPLVIIQKIRNLNQERNGFMHTAALSENQAASKYTELYPDVLEVLLDLSELSSLRLLRYVENSGSVIALRCEVFEGYSLARDVRTIQIDSATLGRVATELNDNNILVNYQGQLFSISPFYHFREGANGNRTDLCYCKRRHSASRYEFEIVAHSEVYETNGTIFDDRINELRGLII